MAAKDADGRPPPWRDVRVLAWFFQLAVAAVVIGVVLWLVDNVRSNSASQGITTGLGFLDQPAGFEIPGNSFRQSQPVRLAIYEGFLNTLRVAMVGIVVATVIGVLVGIARLSHNWLLRTLARAYVEAIRNVPLLGIVGFAYAVIALNTLPQSSRPWRPFDLAVLSNRGVSVPWFVGSGLVVAGLVLAAGCGAALLRRWRRRVSDRTGEPARTALWVVPSFLLVVGWGGYLAGIELTRPVVAGRGIDGGITMGPEYFALLLALTIYTSSHIAEIVRGSIQAVPRGQAEAADAVALSAFQKMWFVVLPQAMRIAVPPVGNQYLNLVKNSSLGFAISYFELTKVTSTTVGNRSPAVPAFLLLMLIYLAISLSISFVVNLVNRRLTLVTR